MEFELNNVKQELEQTRIALQACKRTLEVRDQQIQLQNNRQHEIERIHKELLSEYEKQVQCMKEEIQYMRQSQEKLLNKFKSLQTNAQIKSLQHDNATLLEAIDSLEKLGKSNAIRSQTVLPATSDEITLGEIDKAINSFCIDLEGRVDKASGLDNTIPHAITTLAKMLEESMFVAKRFVSALEKSKEHLEFVLMSQPIPNTVSVERIKNSDGYEKEYKAFLAKAWSQINWEEVTDSREPLNGKLDEDPVLVDLQDKINSHFNKLDQMMTEVSTNGSLTVNQ